MSEVEELRARIVELEAKQLSPAALAEFELGKAQRDKLRDALEAEREVSKELGELLELAEERHQLWLRERAILQRRLRHQRGELAALSRTNEELRGELTRERRKREVF